MKWNCFLDDFRIPRQVTWVKLPLVDWVIVRNYREFVNAVKTRGIPTRVSWDHDLAPNHYVQALGGKKDDSYEENGADCAKWLVNYCIAKGVPLPEYWVHSMNPAGADNIRSILESARGAINDAIRAKESVANRKK